MTTLSTLAADGVPADGVPADGVPTGGAPRASAPRLAQNSVENSVSGPVVRILQPTYADLLRGRVSVVVAAESKRYPAQTVEMFVDDRSATGGAVQIEINPTAEFNWDTSLFPDGMHRLTVRVTDTQGFIGQAEVLVYVNNGSKRDAPPPALEWLSPRPGDVLRGEVDLQLKAAGNFGVRYVFVSINPAATPQRKPAMRWSLLNRPPYTFAFDTTRVPDGMYVIDALAYDALEQEGHAPTLTVGVVNSAIIPTWIQDQLDAIRRTARAEAPGASARPLPGTATASSSAPGASAGGSTGGADGDDRVAVNPDGRNPHHTGPGSPSGRMMTQMTIITPRYATNLSRPDRVAVDTPSVSSSAHHTVGPAATVPEPRSTALSRLLGLDSSSSGAAGAAPAAASLGSRNGMTVAGRSTDFAPARLPGNGVRQEDFQRSNILREGRLPDTLPSFPGSVDVRTSAPAASGEDVKPEGTSGSAQGMSFATVPSAGEMRIAPSAVRPGHTGGPAQGGEQGNVQGNVPPRQSLLPTLPAPPGSRRAGKTAIMVSPLGNWSAQNAVLPAVYVVKRDETLATIAARYKMSPRMLAAVNRMQPAARLARGTQVRLPRALMVSYAGKPVTGDVASMMVGSTSITPFRFLFEAQGGQVSWDAKNRRVFARSAKQEVTLTIGSRQSVVNQKQVMMDLAAFLLSGRTMVPLRFFEKALHAQVEWEPGTGRLYVASANTD